MAFSWTDHEGSSPVAVIRGTSDKRMRNEILYITHSKDKNTFPNIELDGDMTLNPIPDITLERNIVFVAGRSGSGKSHFCSQWLREYKKLYPDNPIYVFSLVDSDDKIDDIGVNRIKIESSLITDPLKIEEFEESCLLFDDIDVIDDKKLREAVYGIMNKGLEIGRHYKVSMMITNHLLTNGRDTRRILNEAQFITIFPASGSFGGIAYMLKKYMGFDTHEIKRVKTARSRWVYIRNTAPMCIVTQVDAYTMAGQSDEYDMIKHKTKRN